MSERASLLRLRLAFGALALALLVPAALLVQRALAGVTAEREARHRAVAERVFDEMERALSTLVAREELRPVEAWGAPLPEEPFVLAAFERAADGRVTAPVPPRDAAALRRVEDWFAARPRTQGDAAGAPDAAQAPGTTVSLAGAEQLRALGYVLPDAEAPAAAKRSAEGAYEALQSLNRGASERADRERKVLAARAPEAQALAKDEAFAVRRESDATATTPAAPPRLVVDPLLGARPDRDTLLLQRAISGAGGVTRQGLVLDVAGLGAWLRARGPAQVAGATLAFDEDDTALAGAGPFRYRHRFAEPFDTLSASLALAPLGSVAGAGPLYALSALLALTATAGLFALYRMAALAMAFAERRSNFVAAVTHELRTPVTAIRLYGEMLRDDLVPSEAKRREYYGTITAESERLGRLVDDVLELARLERGARPLTLVPGALEPVVEEAVERMRPQAERAGFALRSAIAPGLPRARFDRDALVQVLANLVDNACKYARGARERAIEVDCRGEAGRVWLAVRDRGPGVASAQIPLLFEPFHRGEDERVRTAQGTGLGLALVRRLVERMGGTVEGRNAAGGGFEVRIGLPAADEA